MKIKSYQLFTIGFTALALQCSTGCKREFLKPDPLSIYEPTITFTSKAGLQAAITACDRNLSHLWAGENSPLLTDMLFSEEAVCGVTDKSGPAQDLNASITPTSQLDDINYNHIGWFFHEGYKGIGYANTVISNIDNVTGLDAATHDQMLGRAYFHRAFRYLWLVFDFGDVPLLTKAVSSDKVNYKSTKATVILDKITSDMEFAVAHVPAGGDFGLVNKGACQQLLIKCYLATGQFDKAIATANDLINSSGYSLMTNTFGTFINPMPNVHNITRNVIWDLHRWQNKSIGANKETIYDFVNREEQGDSRQDMFTMRNAVPYYGANGLQLIVTPNGNAGMSTSASLTAGKIDLRKTYGRGIAFIRGTWYSNKAIWDDPADLRHSVASGNWMRTEDLVYNNPTLQTIKPTADPYYGQNLQLYNSAGKILVTDTIRTWFDWPHYKLYIESPRSETVDNYNGGAGDWYIYRLAETYLLRAEAYYWKGDLASAAADVNTIRKRAQCTKMYNAAEMTMGKIMDERCRELYYEELRHMELSRVSYIFALTHKADEFGKTYTVANLSKDSYWYNRVITYNDFYRKKVTTTYGTTFSISPYHLLWPVPQSDIDANGGGRINQNFGYSGYEKNEAPYSTLADALAGEN
jgi:hypothetical protein